MDAGSQSDRVLRAVLTAVTDLGAEVEVFSGRDLDLPPYHSGAVCRTGRTTTWTAVRRADALVITSPGYHGTVSGLVKNALDYLEELRGDQRPYLDGRAVGLVAVARGWQASVCHPGHAAAGGARAARVADPAGAGDQQQRHHLRRSRPHRRRLHRRGDRVMAGQLVDFARRWAPPRPDPTLTPLTGRSRLR